MLLTAIYFINLANVGYLKVLHGVACITSCNKGNAYFIDLLSAFVIGALSWFYDQLNRF